MNRSVRLGAVLMAALVLGACSSARDASDLAGGDADEAKAVEQEFSDEGAARDAGGAGGGVTAGGSGSSGSADGAQAPLPNAVPATTGNQQVIRSAELRIELKKGGFREAFERATFLAGSHQGFVVDSSSERSSEGLTSGAVVIRVPAANFDKARKDLATLGKVQSEQVKGEDVSGQLVDIAARLRNLQAQEAALRGLMERSATVPETMQVQTNLFGVREQIEQLTGQEARLKDGVAMSTIRIAIAESGAAILTEPEPEPTGIAAAFRRALDGAVAVVSAAIIAVGYLTPIVVLLGLILMTSRIVRRPQRRLAPEG